LFRAWGNWGFLRSIGIRKHNPAPGGGGAMKKSPKLIREIQAIINDSAMHFWIKCKKLVLIKTYNRPGSYEGAALIREFFKTCAGKHQARFDSAYVRPYLNEWADDRRCFDHVKGAPLNDNLAAKIGRSPRGMKIVRNAGSHQRFAEYLHRKYPEAFKKFEEIKKVRRSWGASTERTNDFAWEHIFGDMGQYPASRNRRKITKVTQDNRRKLDLAMEKAQVDYNKLKKASGLPPRYLYNEVPLIELQDEHKNHTYATFEGRYITTDTVLHYDDSKVHHGLGKLTHTNREIAIRNGKGIVFLKPLKVYAGHFVLNAIEEYFGLKLKRINVCAELKPVQLNPKMEVIETVGPDTPGFRTFQRLLAGTHYDYCVLRDGVTYHAASIDQCVVGWEKKKAAKKTDSKIINMKLCRRLGFCKEGVRGFCNANDLEKDSEYTLGYLKRIVKKNLSHNRCYYGYELKQIGIL